MTCNLKTAPGRRDSSRNSNGACVCVCGCVYVCGVCACEADVEVEHTSGGGGVPGQLSAFAGNGCVGEGGVCGGGNDVRLSTRREAGWGGVPGQLSAAPLFKSLTFSRV